MEMPYRRITPERQTLILATFFGLISDVINGEGSTCYQDGYQLDYSSGCREYFKCSSGELAFRDSCAKQKVFSLISGKCLPKNPHTCISRKCEYDDAMAYVSPGSRCRIYYRCTKGVAVDSVCPYGTWFDFERQACTKGAGACYEPICVGLPDGIYPDNSHNCKRLIECKGSYVKNVQPCFANECPRECAPPRTTSVSVPVGEVDLCTDELCTSLCIFEKDGFHPDISTGCKEFFKCQNGRVIQRGVCDVNMIFSHGECKHKRIATCPPPKKGKCFGKPDGAHTDWKDCRSWYICKRDKVIAAERCDENSVWDGRNCVSNNTFLCNGPIPSQDCLQRPKGYYQDLDSSCRKYYWCEQGEKFMFECGSGTAFNGISCADVNSFTCPSMDEESCYMKSDGKYFISGSGCRGYYICSSGEKSMHACGRGLMFNGIACVHAINDSCDDKIRPCLELSNGYHADLSAGCRRYFFCEDGDRIATLECAGDKIFDGNRCVDPKSYDCGEKKLTEASATFLCEKDGFFTMPNTNCKNYYFCIEGKLTPLRCALGNVFNGSICVPVSEFKCKI